MKGLLDALRDPEQMARIAERRRLMDYVAEQLSLRPEDVRSILDNADKVAIESFYVGNTIPREVLH